MGESLSASRPAGIGEGSSDGRAGGGGDRDAGAVRGDCVLCTTVDGPLLSKLWRRSVSATLSPTGRGPGEGATTGFVSGSAAGAGRADGSVATSGSSAGGEGIAGAGARRWAWRAACDGGEISTGCCGAGRGRERRSGPATAPTTPPIRKTSAPTSASRSPRRFHSVRRRKVFWIRHLTSGRGSSGACLALWIKSATFVGSFSGDRSAKRVGSRSPGLMVLLPCSRGREAWPVPGASEPKPSQD